MTSTALDIGPPPRYVSPLLVSVACGEFKIIFFESVAALILEEYLKKGVMVGLIFFAFLLDWTMLDNLV